ncbi:hypothetical protein CRUP_002177 [Coryphaenoides rupestris]|nr:hypothetical protein CRUP_002177 [Coryphaenoides rupestris]
MAKKRQRKSNDGRSQSDVKAQRTGPQRTGAQGTGDPDDHFNQIPFRLREIMKSQEMMKKKNKKKKNETKPKTITYIPVPHFKRRKEESKRAYLRRMDHETDHVFFLTKNQLERKPELEEEKQEKPANSGKSEKKTEYNKLRLQRLHQKKLNRQEKEMEKTMFIDKVEFGEVAMAPPTLSVKPRKAPEKTSMARKRIMEEERERVVEAYRHLKRQKQRQQELRSAGLKKLKDL